MKGAILACFTAFANELQVGHDMSSLSEASTFKSLYLDPIIDTLKRQNPTTKFVPSKTNFGVYDTSTDQTLYLWIDLKTAGNTTLPAVIDALKPLNDAGYLTTYNG